MAFLKLADETGEMRMMVMPRQYEMYSSSDILPSNNIRALSWRYSFSEICPFYFMLKYRWMDP